MFNLSGRASERVRTVQAGSAAERIMADAELVGSRVWNTRRGQAKFSAGHKLLVSPPRLQLTCPCQNETA